MVARRNNGIALLVFVVARLACAQGSITDSIHRVESKMAKIYGAGGLRGLESYQSGFLISAGGHVLTSWSYVLDTDPVLVTLADGSRYDATMVGADPRCEIAVLKIDATTPDYFDLSQAVTLEVGDPVLAFSNLYRIATGNEPCSVLQGTVAATTQLSARRGVFKSPYQGPIYVLDAVTNNSGASGGALTDHEGQISGILGKELRSSETNAWLNYAIPISQIRDSVEAILTGKALPASRLEAESAPAASPWSLDHMGVRLVPNVLAITPPYIESVLVGSVAADAGMQTDDLIIHVDHVLVRSCDDVLKQLRSIDRLEPLSLSILRDQEMLEINLPSVAQRKSETSPPDASNAPNRDNP